METMHPFAIGQRVFFVGVQQVKTHLRVLPTAAVLAVLEGTVVEIDEEQDYIWVAVPNGHKSPWAKQPHDLFFNDLEAAAELEVLKEEHRQLIAAMRDAPSIRDPLAPQDAVFAQAVQGFVPTPRVYHDDSPPDPRRPAG